MIETLDNINSEKYLGSGTLTSLDKEFYTTFSLYIFPTAIRIFANYKSDFPCNILKGDWHLKGLLNDNREILCERLLPRRNDGNIIELQPNGEIIIGNYQHNNIIEGQFPLLDFYDNNLELKFDDWEFSINKLPSKNCKLLREVWNLPIEGSILTIKNYKTDSVNNFANKADEIRLLLSIANGGLVIFNKQMFTTKDNLTFEKYWLKKEGDLTINNIIPDFELDNYFSLCYSTYNQLTDNEKKVIYIVVNFLNSSSQGFIEDRLFRLILSIEILANEWTSKKGELSKELQELRKELNKVATDWRDKNKEFDKDGFWKQRVLNSVDWERFMKQIEVLIKDFSIKIKDLEIDLILMKKIRDSVAHSGTINNEITYSPYIIKSYQFFIRLIILLKLGYKGLIQVGNMKNLTTEYININDFIE